MAERQRSKDGSRDTEKVLGEKGKVEHMDRGTSSGGGDLSRDIGTRDELKRAEDRPAGVTRVRKGDRPNDPPEGSTGKRES
ncbi:hypothetical protein [Roseitranquillus sediminis]|uniref:hypothetical protein n=1 Tax=Roseitranquillus sediminis TaxID=2809051 RepID=UPI001D0C6D4E|nr:hypothetical protein [Roseitranquillus sediminis]MBM9594327.1 hypothetical protein [Roseitranquillus sediminis]